MSKVMTFSRTFPAYHPKAGQPTYFVEKIWKGLWDLEKSNHNPLNGYHQIYDEAFPITNDPLENIHLHQPKWHTIRAGNRWKFGDKFSPRVWSGKPYGSKQITIAPDIEVKKVWDFKIDDCGVISVGGYYDFSDNPESNYEILAKNDGLTETEMLQWFNKPMTGQIICWNEEINY